MADDEGHAEASTRAWVSTLGCVEECEGCDCWCWGFVSWCVVLRRFLGVASSLSLFAACACLRLLCDQPTFAACDLTYFLFSRPEDLDSKTKLSPPLSALLDDCIPSGGADGAKTFRNSTLPSRASDVHVEPPDSAFPMHHLRVAILVERILSEGAQRAVSRTGRDCKQWPRFISMRACHAVCSIWAVALSAP